MDAAGVRAMMGGFLAAFPDLQYAFDFFVVDDDLVVQRYTATGTQEGRLATYPPLVAPPPGRESTSSASSVAGLPRFGQRSMP